VPKTFRANETVRKRVDCSNLSTVLSKIRARVARHGGGFVVQGGVTEQILGFARRRKGGGENDDGDHPSASYLDIHYVIKNGAIRSASENTVPPGAEALLAGFTRDAWALEIRVLLADDEEVPLQVVHLLLRGIDL
jgi:hypothetical protein